ncbi:MAG: hypothetical protein IKI69_07995 [Oscillospiraceae bacterium]|nr:hypothetical protein [Oscillospiraceae bacterium]
MDNREIKENSVWQPLGDAITDLDRRELCSLVVALCCQIQDEVGTGAFRGGVYPDNVSRDDNGSWRLGPAAAEGEWEGQEREFLAPELFWNGEKGPSADVYSLGMLLYYAVNCARMPFYKSGEDGARQRRMNGEAIKAPKAAGRRLSEIIEKALAFQIGERYQSVEELKAALLSCVDNIYLSGPVSAEQLYNKSEDDLSHVEKMMLDILRKEEDAQMDAADSGEEEEAPTEPVVGPLMQQPEPESEPPSEPEPESEPEQKPIVILTEEKNPELEPVVIGRPAPVQYQNSTERERSIAKKIRRRRRRPFIMILLAVAILLSAAALYDYIQARRPDEPVPPPTETTAPNEVLAPAETPTPSEAPVEATPEPTEEPAPKESTYQVIVGDVSWITARDSSIYAGGHLVVINDEEEFRRVIAAVEEFNVSYVWIGCRRVDGAMTWVKDAEIDFWPWASGEPSIVDGYVPEDYLMLSYSDGRWGYNDNRNDPAGDYPAFYSGRIAYVIEFEPEA